MPGFAHIIIALGLSIFIWKISNNKFTPKHAIIFSVNALVGPDMFGVLEYGNVHYNFFHGMGWFLAAALLALPWSLFTKYSLSWRPFKVQKRDLQREVVTSVLEVFCIIAAGGMFHQLVDIVGHPATITTVAEGVIPWGVVWFGGNAWFSVDSILGTGMFPCGNAFGFPEFFAFSIPAIVAGIVLLLFFSHKSKKAFIWLSTLIIIGYAIPLSISYFIPDLSGFNVTAPGVNYFGDPGNVPSTYRLTGGEADLGVLVYFGIFLFLPLALLWMSYSGIPGIKITGLRAEIREIEKEERARVEDRVKALYHERVRYPLP
jgi:hypothetical protein